jgi:hypothetical protein
VPTRGHEDDPGFLSLLINIMSCHLFFICGTLFNADDPPIESSLMSGSARVRAVVTNL